MIQKFSDILKAFMDEESKKLSEFKVTHGPTIGSMYEGLSAKLIEAALPTELDLRVASGFAVDRLGNMSGQIDCMLVRGAGELIPHTSSYTWPIDDVLAVFEIKKKLTYADLTDSFAHLRQINDSYRAFLDQSGPDLKLDLRSAMQAFSRVTGVHSRGRTDNVPEHLQMLHYTLMIEQLSPVRIVWAYGGYKRQSTLRAAMIRLLNEAVTNTDGQGFGVPSFPQLISSNGISLIKGNGQPYYLPLCGEYWPFYFSSTANPLRIMLELIWTKISTTYGIAGPPDEDLTEEVFAPFLSAKPVELNGRTGWYYQETVIPNLDGNSRQTQDWRPREITIDQSVVLHRVINEGELDTSKEELVNWLVQRRYEPSAFIQDLVATSFVALDGKYLRPTTDVLNIVYSPDGKIWVHNVVEQMAAFASAEAKKIQENKAKKGEENDDSSTDWI